MNAKKQAKVVVASDQAIFLRGLASLVVSMPEMTLVGEAAGAVEAVQICQMSQPDLALLDLKDTAQVGQILREMRRRCPALRVVWMLDGEALPPAAPDDPLLFCLSRDASEQELKAALAQILGCAISPQDGDFRLADPRPAQRSKAPLDPFEPREIVLTRELAMAGKIQADILPEEPPFFPGWEIAVRLIPARETSGDFYDFIPLSQRKWGVVVADVTDKGMGAALFMALSSTLIRTYAARYPTLPVMAMSTVSDRILSDTRGSTFVTAFYGILEPDIGRLVYCNAGHPPGYLVSSHRGEADFDALRPTGMALGASDEARWRQKVARFSPGDFLVLYTDGVTEAENAQGAFFGEEGLLDAMLAKPDGTAAEIQKAVLDAVQDFVGGAPQQDDIAVMVIRRKPL